MSFFKRLKTSGIRRVRAYPSTPSPTPWPTVRSTEARFRHVPRSGLPVPDRVCPRLRALGLKSPKISLTCSTRRAGLSAHDRVDMNLHVKLCAAGACRSAIFEQTPPRWRAGLYAPTCSTRSRRVICWHSVALAPCVIGYAAIRKRRLRLGPLAYAATNPYRVWIADIGAPYHDGRGEARAQLDPLARLGDPRDAGP